MANKMDGEEEIDQLTTMVYVIGDTPRVLNKMKALSA